MQRRAATNDGFSSVGTDGKVALLQEAKKLKEDLQQFESWENAVKAEMEALALEIPNLSSASTPVGSEATTIALLGSSPESLHGTSHVGIGRELDIIDFEASATTSGWGWYFLKNEGALLEQALIRYALEVAMNYGWKVMTPPSLVYAHIASACGFMPRDQNGETQRYGIASDASENDLGRPGLVLAGTAEIPFAGSQANKTLSDSTLPLKVIGPSRSYRAEAGARGVDTKGLYRVHEFTKVEMFAWTAPPSSAAHQEGDRFGVDSEDDLTDTVFVEMLDIQQEIVINLGLHARVLEMPSTDLGASASRKVDIEAFFPSRTAINDGYGEVTSASICTDYQSRRLSTRYKSEGKAAGSGGLGFPYTLNGTALAVPRMLACVLENWWDERSRTVTVPPVLRKHMLGGAEKIG